MVKTLTFSMAIDIQREEVLLPTDRRGMTTKTNVNRTNKPSTKTGHLHKSDGQEPLCGAMNERMRQPESRAPYSRRKTIVEPVFGQIKNAGFRGFGVRGKARVAGEFSLVCAAHNLKKIILAAVRGEVCPEFGKRAALA